MSDNTVINVEHVSKSFLLPHEKHTSVKSLFTNMFQKRTFEKQEAVKDISFEVKEGEFFGIVGRNGSGKSTLAAGLAAPVADRAVSARFSAGGRPALSLTLGCAGFALGLAAAGLAAGLLVAAGFGEFTPLDPAETEEAYRRNHRIEFKLTEG